MGLDMYLYAEKYVGGWDHHRDANFDVASSIIALPTAKSSPHVLVKKCVAYWRKANSIHSWFVQNVQGGTDDCGTYYVDPEKLTELRDLAQKALTAYDNDYRDEAARLLTPTSGFFFGSTEVDDWYRADLHDTVKQLTALIEAEAPGVDFYYHSSW